MASEHKKRTESTGNVLMDQMIDRMYEYTQDFPRYAAEMIKIKDHASGQIVPLELNAGQWILHNVAEKQRAEKGFVRILLLKTRRFGGSTYIEGRYYWRTSLTANRNAFIVGHEEESTRTLYQMAQLIHERNELKPSTKTSNAQELIFDTPQGDGLKSQYRLATARNLYAGRSQGFHYGHDSEEAYWPDADTLLAGLLACLPPPGSGVETEFFRESTGNGFGNTFQRDVFAAYANGQFPYYQQDGRTYAWKSPESDWILVLVPWYVHDRYTMNFDSEHQKLEFEKKLQQKVFDKDRQIWEDSEAKKLQTKFGLSLEQLLWRDWAIKNVCKGRVEVFRQEYPSIVEEAFLSAGSSMYSKELCDQVELGCVDPVIIGDMVDRMGKPKIRPNPYGHFREWEKPDDGESYFMTVDTAGGIKKSQVDKQREPDPSCIDVWNHYTGKQVAQWHGHIDYDEIADLVEMIGRKYGKATACVELNNHGHTVVADLKRLGYPQYYAAKDSPGFLTTTKTRPVLVDGLLESSRDGALHIRCRETVSEMRTFVEIGNKYEAASGCHDERVITAGMASMMMTLLPRKRSKREGAGKKQETGFSNWKNRSSDRRQTDYVEVRV